MHNEQLDKRRLHFVSFISFILGFGQAVLLYIMSSYFESASGTDNVGIFYLSAYAIELIILFQFHKIVSAVGKTRTFLIIVLAKIPLLFWLAMVSPSLGGVFAMTLYIIVGNIGWVCLDMILESCSSDRMSGRIRGLHLTILNAGYLFGPFLSTWMLEKFDFQGVFVFMVILYSFMFVISLVGLRNFHYPVRKRSTVRQLLHAVSQRKNILRIYYISFVLEFFYALMVIFTPIYLRHLGLSWEYVGIIFTMMLVPFVLFQYPAGFLADKRMGEKELIIFPIFIMGATTLSLYFFNSLSVVLWSIILFSTRIGASLIEILRDSYFYKRIGSTDIDIIDFFRTSRPLAYVFASISSTFFLFLFSDIKTIFILVAVVVFSALYPAFKLNDNKSEKEIISASSHI